jgi:NNP family nitrate/nitrite transporter-like MFS transporter
VTDKGIDRNWANTIIAASRISGIGMAFLAGWITDRVGAGRTMTMVFLLTGIATLLLGAASNSWVILVVFLQPVVAVCFFPPGFAALSSIGPSHSRNVAVSLTVPVAFIFGGGLIPMAIGMMGDAGYFSLGISVVGGIILGGSALSLGVKVTNVGK